jgi:hypothetical protein
MTVTVTTMTMMIVEEHCEGYVQHRTVHLHVNKSRKLSYRI